MIESHGSRSRVVYGGALLVAAALLGLPSRAAAEGHERDRCFDAYEQAQRLRRDGKLSASHDQLAVCADASCPKFVKADCKGWLDEVDASMASLVVVTKGKSATTEGSLAVFVDGARLAQPSDGSPVPVDPGPHDVRYEYNGRFVESHVVVPQGFKAFPLIVDFHELAPPPPAAPVAPPAPPPPLPPEAPTPPRRPAGIPLLAYGLGGVALAGLGMFAGFGLAGNAGESCAPSCTRSQVSAIGTNFLVADVSLAAAIAAGAAAVYFALTSRSDAPIHAKTPAASAWWLGAAPGTETGNAGATITAGARF
jgi:hypothetical protein